MKPWMIKLGTVLLTCSLVVAFAGCAEEGPAEDALEDAGDRIEDTAEDAGDAMDQMGEETGDAMGEAVDETQDAADQMADEVDPNTPPPSE